MIRLRPTKDQGVAKQDTRRRAARTEQAIDEVRHEPKPEKSQRLRKWEMSTSRPIDEGYELALSDDVRPRTSDWEGETEDIQLAILASLGLLDDYEAEDADITLSSLPRNDDFYSIRYKPSRKKTNVHGFLEEVEVPILDDEVDWELVKVSLNEGSMSWTMLDE
ncbi:hypothetical protein DHEL01_v200605 [Diaporthe helianthi]|uniref:Uncharacterized protein n=1 Tax=Diaporthe helianthi TaxID=158607 RepID=A0A2P5IEW2_DIAHE|nr:hypothetical protein DHEL01_v200605 [Diaporthe helianthi]